MRRSSRVFLTGVSVIVILAGAPTSAEARTQDELLTGVEQLGGASQETYLGAFPTMAVVKTNLEARLQVPDMPIDDQQQMDALLGLMGRHANAWQRLQAGRASPVAGLADIQAAISAAKSLKGDLGTSLLDPDAVDLLLVATYDLLRSAAGLAHASAQAPVTIPTAQRLAYLEAAIDAARTAGSSASAGSLQLEWDALSRTYRRDLSNADDAMRSAEALRATSSRFLPTLILQFTQMQTARSALEGSMVRLQVHGEAERLQTAQADLASLNVQLAATHGSLLQPLLVYLTLCTAGAAWAVHATVRWNDDRNTAGLGSGMPGV
ncbi:MAG: hypothetical protein ABR586_08225 [Thermoplasmatota archaeon]